MDNTWNEIHEQPEALERLLTAEWRNVQTIAAAIRSGGVRWVLFAARGTSDHAAIYAQYLFGWCHHLPSALATPSLYTLYQAPPRLVDVLVIGVSQSGRSPDVVAVVDAARQQGQLTLAITNETNSPLAKAARFVIPLHAGPEHSVAATKTYTAELLAAAMLSAALSADPVRLEELRALPGQTARTLELNASIIAQAERYRYMTQTVALGRGLTYSTALEAGLKLKEMTYISANAYSTADFMHGPIAILEPGFPLLAVAPSGTTYPDLLAALGECRRRGAEPIVISDMPQALELAQTQLPLPAGVPEWLTPIPAIIPAQLLARSVALVKGLNPDTPRGLHKITETR
ncbi:MAG: SIS domain-containing protein [Chloroflexi bacterium]|nr:SIS domain-containing protein [Chloroflexota bacterium]